MICRSAFLANTSADESCHQLFLWNIYVENMVYLLASAAQESIQGNCLFHCSWKSVKQKSVCAIIFGQSVRSDFYDQAVRYQFSPVHIFLSFLAQLCTFGNVLSEDEVTEAAAKLTSVKSEEGIKKHHEEFQKDAKAFFEENKEALEKKKKKEANGEELTEEEKALKLQRDNFYTAVSAGEISGTAMNEIVADAVKREILSTLNKDAYELPNYKEVIKQVTEFVENNPEALTMPKEEIVKLLDEATNGNYSTVVSGSEQTLKAPAEKPVETAETPDYGFTQKTEVVDTSRLESLKQQFYSEESNPFTVEKREESISTNPAKTTSKLQAKLSGMNSQEQMNYIAKNFHNFSYGVKNAIGTKLEQLGHNNLMRVLSKINSDSFILGVYKQLGLKQDDIEDLNISTGAKKIMLNNLQREEERA